jgi:hypothetical protein
MAVFNFHKAPKLSPEESNRPVSREVLVPREAQQSISCPTQHGSAYSTPSEGPRPSRYSSGARLVEILFFIPIVASHTIAMENTPRIWLLFVLSSAAQDGSDSAGGSWLDSSWLSR